MERHPRMTIWKPTNEFPEELSIAIKFNLRVDPKRGLVITLIDTRKVEVDFVYDSAVEYMGDRVVSFRYTSEIPMTFYLKNIGLLRRLNVLIEQTEQAS